jgi:signal transduction histidine kinase
VNNAIKHGDSKRILIRLTAEQGRGRLVIKDDGSGISESAVNSRGMGLHIMKYRSGMIGGSLEIRPDTPRGTIVTCTFPVKEVE